jgi:hypothetical protein
MAQSEITEKWLERVVYDMDTARAMLRTKRYIYVVFMCVSGDVKMSQNWPFKNAAQM